MRKLCQALLALPLAGALAAQDVAAFEFEVETLGGGKIAHGDFANNAVIVDLWGTWCGPCVQAVPVLESMYRKYKQYGLEIVGLNYEIARGDHAAIVRKFAAKHGISYQLALGTPAIKGQVKGFRGYPTMLFFGKGMKHEKTKVGFTPDEAVEMERWIRSALDLADGEGPEFDAKGTGPGDEAGDEDEPEEEVVEEEEAEERESEKLADGVIFKPGDHDTGFDFEEKDVDGSDIEFQKLCAQQPVLLALTSTWDGSAADVAKLLQALHEKYAGKAQIVAASLERARQRAAKVHAIKAFREKHSLSYRLVPSGLGMVRKVHMFPGMPVFLVFDTNGKLMHRENSLSDKTRAALEANLDGLVK